MVRGATLAGGVALALAASLAGADVPRQADLSIIGVHLLDLDSQRRVLGAVKFSERTAMPEARFASADGKQVMTLVSHPGSVGDVAEVKVAYGKGRPDPRFRTFVSGKGIELGLPEEKVREILGEPTRMRSLRNGLRTILYRIEEGPERPSAFLERYAMPVYYGAYVFQNGRLIQFRFGFEYP